MWILFTLLVLFVLASSENIDSCNHPFNDKNRCVFYNFGLANNLFNTNYTIVNIVVPFKGFTLERTGENWKNHPQVFFNLIDNSDVEDIYKGQYVLINKTAHKIFDGRDATLDRSLPDATIYFAAKDGIYTYEEETKSAIKYGTNNDDILTIEKVVGEEKLFILTVDHKVYEVTEQGTVKNQVKGIKHAKDFILDLLGAIYFYGEDNKPKVLKQGDVVPYNFDSEFNFDIDNALFVRPSLNYDFNGIIFIANGLQYFLVNCSAVENIPNIKRVEGISGYNAESFVYQFISVGGELFEHNLLGGAKVKEQEVTIPFFQRNRESRKTRKDRNKLENL